MTPHPAFTATQRAALLAMAATDKPFVVALLLQSIALTRSCILTAQRAYDSAQVSGHCDKLRELHALLDEVIHLPGGEGAA